MVCGAVYVWRNKMSYSLVFAGLSALVLNMTAYGNILPSLDKLKLADRLVDTFERNNIPLPRDGGPRVQAVNFTEPSLVYQFGKEVRLGDQIDMKTPSTWSLGNIFIIDDREEKGERFDRFLQLDAKENGHCLKEHAVVSGNNYSRGDSVNLHVIEVVVCEKS